MFQSGLDYGILRENSFEFEVGQPGYWRYRTEAEWGNTVMTDKDDECELGYWIG